MCATGICLFSLSIIARLAFSPNMFSHGTPHSNSAICFPIENSQAFTSTISFKNRSESFRTTMRVRGFARGTPKARTENLDAAMQEGFVFLQLTLHSMKGRSHFHEMGKETPTIGMFVVGSVEAITREVVTDLAVLDLG
jgi:hypothetical protein